MGCLNHYDGLPKMTHKIWEPGHMSSQGHQASRLEVAEKERKMDNLIAETLKSLEQNNFKTAYAEDIEAAHEKVLELIPKGATVGVGDSVSVRQLGVLDELRAQGRLLIDPFSREISLMSTTREITESQRWEMHKLAVDCEFFITGTNAITRDGKLVNTDAGGNRVAGMIFGPRNVVIVVGRNKIVQDLNEALYRIKNVIAPQLCKITERKAPCVKVGRCTDCKSEERACNVTTILEKRPTYTGFTVVMVNEDLGLGWDEDWPKERIDRIYSDCAELTWLKGRPGLTANLADDQ